MNIKSPCVWSVLIISIISFSYCVPVYAQSTLTVSDSVSVGLDAASDSGISTTDNITNLVRPTFRGKAPFQARVTVKLNGSPVCRTTALANASYSCKSEIDLPDASYSAIAETTKFFSKNASIVIDTKNVTAPTVPVLGAISDTGVSSADMKTTAKLLQIKGFGEPGAKVDVYANGLLACSSSIATGNIYQCTYSVPKLGTYKLKSIETDVAGNKSVFTAESNVVVVSSIPNNAVPSVPDLDTASDSGVLNNDNITNVKNPLIIGTGVAGLNVQLIADGKTLCTTVVKTDGTYACSPVLSLDKKYTISARYYAEDGSTETQSTGLDLTLKTAISAPTLPDLSSESDTGTSSTDNITFSKSLKLVGTNESGAKVSVLVNNVLVHTVTLENNVTTWMYTHTVTTLGSYDVVVRQSDSAGNVSADSTVLHIVVERQPETVAVPNTPDLATNSDSGALSTDNITNDSTPTFTGASGVFGNTIQYFAGELKICETKVLENNSYECTVTTALRDGVYAVSAKQINSFGDISRSGPVLSITIDTSNPVGASLPDLLTISDDGENTTDNTTTLTLLQLAGFAEKKSNISVLVNDVSVYATQLPDNTGTNGVPWKFIHTAPGVGVYNIKVTETDLAGNVAPVSPVLVVTVLGPIIVEKVQTTPVLKWAEGLNNMNELNNFISIETRPVFKGVASVGKKIAIIEKSVSDLNSQNLKNTNKIICTATAFSVQIGSYECTANADFATGIHTLVAMYVDKNNQPIAGSESPSINIATDVDLPSKPEMPDLLSVSDDGVSDSDNITTIKDFVILEQIPNSANVSFQVECNDINFIFCIYESDSNVIKRTIGFRVSNTGVYTYGLGYTKEMFRSGSGIYQNSQASEPLVVTVIDSTPQIPAITNTVTQPE